MCNTNKLNLAGILTSIFVFILPFVIFFRSIPYGATNSKYFFIVSFAVIIGLYFSYLVFTGKHKITIKGRKLLYILSIVLLVHYISAYFGVDFLRSLWSDILRSTGLLFLTSIAFLAFVLSELLNKKDWKNIFKSIIFSSTIFAFLTFFAEEGFGLKAKFLFVDFGMHGLTFGNSTFAGSYLVLGFILTLIAIIRSEKDSRHRKVFVTAAFIQFVSPMIINWEIFSNPLYVISNPINLLGSSRASGATAILAVIYLLGIILIRRFGDIKIKKVLPIYIVSFFVFVSIFVSLLFVPESFVREKYIESSGSARLVIWDIGLSAFKERPLLGWGPENFRIAFDHNFNYELYLDERLVEVWIDRGHNIFIDTLVSVGIIGLLSIIILLVYFVRVVYMAKGKGLIRWEEASLLGALVFFHLLQIQTSFDTVSTYALLGVILAYGLWLEKKIIHESSSISELKNGGINIQKGVAIVLVIVILFGAKNIIFDEYSRQRSLPKIFSPINTHVQQAYYINKLFEGKTDFESLRLSSASFIKGFLSQIQTTNPQEVGKLVDIAKEQLNLYEIYYLDYMEKSPEDYRIRMNYSYLLFVKTFIGENRIDDAKQIITDSYELSPNNPLTHTMDSLIYFYSGNPVMSNKKINEAMAYSPDIKFVTDVIKYMEAQKRSYPKIAPIFLGNL